MSTLSFAPLSSGKKFHFLTPGVITWSKAGPGPAESIVSRHHSLRDLFGISFSLKLI
jgi:hypothetical protein